MWPARQALPDLLHDLSGFAGRSRCTAQCPLARGQSGRRLRTAPEVLRQLMAPTKDVNLLRDILRVQHHPPTRGIGDRVDRHRPVCSGSGMLVVGRGQVRWRRAGPASPSTTTTGGAPSSVPEMLRRLDHLWGAVCPH